MRHLFGLSGNAVTAGAIGSSATRTTAQAVSAYIAGFMPALP
jgi:hypothetical protein